MIMKQTVKYIEELLIKFVNGQTTETEEQLLADYFQNTNIVPDEWQMYKEMFDSFTTEAYDFNQEELEALLIPVSAEKSKTVRIWSWFSAACIAAIVGLFIGYNKIENPLLTKHITSSENSKEITTNELLETINLLAGVVDENVIITSLPDNEGFTVKTISNSGESNSYTLRRCDDSSSLELKSQIINF